jgi:hypothetical protein
MALVAWPFETVARVLLLVNLMNWSPSHGTAVFGALRDRGDSAFLASAAHGEAEARASFLADE